MSQHQLNITESYFGNDSKNNSCSSISLKKNSSKSSISLISFFNNEIEVEDD